MSLAELYFSTVKCGLSPIEGEVNAVTKDSMTAKTNDDEEALKIARSRKDPFFSKTYNTLIQVPFIPATDVHCQPLKKELLPKEIQVPLVQAKDGKLEGMKSGIRSCVVELSNGKYYRLKGCGNNDELFILRKRKGFSEVRGCTFFHTTTRALYMTKYIGELLAPHGIETANSPVGYFKYSLKDLKEDDVPKYCAVMETLGEKRLSDHVILGIEKVLPLFIRVSKFESLMSLFGEAKRMVRGEDGKVVTTDMVVICGEESVGKMVDIFKFEDFEFDIPPKEKESEIFGKLIDMKIWSTELSKCLSILRSIPKSIARWIVPVLYWRFGVESGNISHILHSSNTLWGTYTDNLGIHCNMHPNNLVLKLDSHAKKGSKEEFLAPLDFDMAFPQSQFVDTTEKYEEYERLEVQGMRIALAGGDINTGCRIAEKYESEKLDVFRTALRDVLLLGFQKAYGDGKKRKKVGPILPSKKMEIENKILYAFLTIALMTTEKYIA